MGDYRYAAGWINSSKQALRSHEIVDPFAVEHGWFELLLPSLQLVVTDRVPAAWRERAERMLVGSISVTTSESCDSAGSGTGCIRLES